MTFATVQFVTYFMGDASARNEEKRKLRHYGYYRYKIAEQRTIEITKGNIDRQHNHFPSFRTSVQEILLPSTCVEILLLSTFGVVCCSCVFEITNFENSY